jgi:hypothetical protein
MLAMMGFEVKRGIASREEMEKASRMMRSKDVEQESKTPKLDPSSKVQPSSSQKQSATEEQKGEILRCLEELRPRDRRAQATLLIELTGKQSRDELTQGEASDLIERLRSEPPW